MKIYTKTGDQGSTSLVGGSRIAKDDPRLKAYGTVDELNSFIGLLSDQQSLSEEQKNQLQLIQHTLFNLGSQLACQPDEWEKYKINVIDEKDISLIELYIDQMQDSLEPLKHFVLPGGHTSVSLSHVCRSITRRAERKVVSLKNDGAEGLLLVIKYLNRLSDYFFVLSRTAAKQTNTPERYW